MRVVSKMPLEIQVLPEGASLRSSEKEGRVEVERDGERAEQSEQVQRVRAVAEIIRLLADAAHKRVDLDINKSLLAIHPLYYPFCSLAFPMLLSHFDHPIHIARTTRHRYSLVFVSAPECPLEI